MKSFGVGSAFLLALASSLASSCALVHDEWQPARAEPDPIPSWGPDDQSPPGWSEATSVPVRAVPEGPLEITIEEAVLMAMENNRSLRIERLNPSIRRTFEEQERAAFDPVLSAEFHVDREKTDEETGSEDTATARGGGVAVSERLPTGTDIGVGLTSERTEDADTPGQYASRAGLSVTQSLLRGLSVAVNLADLRQARLDTIYSEYEFRGFAEALVAETETVYWQYVLARRQVEIVQQSLDLAGKQLDDTRHRIRVGQLAETELAAGEAEVALRQESLINARSLVESLQVKLLRLMCPQRLPSREREIIPRTDPMVPPLPLDSLADHVAVALRLRPDLNQAALLVQKGDLEIVKTRNGLLPRLDLFITLGQTGYADSFPESFRDMDGDGYDLSAGLEFEFPPVNRDARASDERATLTKQQIEESLENLSDLARKDVELAFIEVRRASQQVVATAITRRFQEEKLRAETAKFRVGKSTALLVAGAQRDLLVSQVAEVASVTINLNARINFYLMEGSLLERRGLVAPGREPAPAGEKSVPASIVRPTPKVMATITGMIYGLLF